MKVAGWLVGWLQCVLSTPTLHKKAIQVVIIADKQFCVDEKNINRKRWQIKSRINPQEKKRKNPIFGQFFSAFTPNFRLAMALSINLLNLNGSFRVDFSSETDRMKE